MTGPRCDDLKAAIDDPAVVIGYSPVMRSFGILVHDVGLTAPKGGWFAPRSFTITHRIDFCPWCGTPFPGSLRDAYFEVLEQSYKITDPLDTPLEDLPAEMRSDAWWIKRTMGPTNPALRPDWQKPGPILKARIIGPECGYVWREPRPEHLVGDPTVVPPGFERPRGHPPHMCTAMAHAFNDCGVMIAYLPHIGEYGIRIVDGSRPLDHQPIRIKAIRYCPWCGDPLPLSLRLVWENQLAALGFTPDAPDIPEKFLTERWWGGHSFMFADLSSLPESAEEAAHCQRLWNRPPVRQVCRRAADRRKHRRRAAADAPARRHPPPRR